jgi:tRNA threonylcarbamoyladenosine biosynthesis protein TsaB
VKSCASDFSPQRTHAKDRRVRILGFETSTRRGSVAAVEDGRVLASAEHEVENAHAEQLIGLIERVLAEVGWTKSSLDRLGVGIGPGSFTGLRVGIALAQGIALGLDRPLAGVGSLRAMARGVPAEETRLRVAVLDARRNELFIAAYRSDHSAALAPLAIPRATALETLTGLLQGEAFVLVGDGSALLGPELPRIQRADLDLPHASWVGVLAGEVDPHEAVPEPEYVRGPGAILPNLPPSPLDSPQR